MGHFSKIVLIFIFVITQFCTCENITVYRSAGFKGPSLKLVVSDCVATLDTDWDQSFEAINSQDNCVQLYQEQFCTGKYLIVRPGTQDHHNLDSYGFANRVRSIGLCFEKCHPDNIVVVSEVKVELYDNKEDAPHDRVTVQADKCIPMKEKLSRWSSQLSVKIKVPTTSCVEFHRFGDCTGPSEQFNVGAHSTLGKATFHPEVAKSLSLSFCGYNCNHSYTLEQLDKDDIEPEEGSITLFRHIDFGGERTGLVLRGCTQLPRRWSGNSTMTPRSVIAYATCIQFYEDGGCKDGSGLEAVTGAEPYLVWENKTVKAVKKCQTTIKAEALSGGGGSFMIFFVICCLIVVFVEAGIIYRMRMNSRSYRRGNDNCNLI